MATRKTPPKRDGRPLDHKTLEQLRLRAVEHIEVGERVTDVARVIGFESSVVSRWMSTYRKHGIEALYSRKAPGPKARLDDDQVALIRHIIVSTSPPIWYFPTVTWTRAMVCLLIEKGFGVSYSEEAVGKLMRHRMGLTPQRPLRRAFERDEAQVKLWLESEYPTIRDEAEKAGARIFFADESAAKSDYHSGTSWAPRGQTPVVDETGQRFSINLISAISPEGELRWMEVEGRMNGERFVEFLEAMVKGRRKPIYLIVEGHPAHRAKVVTRWLEKNSKRLRMFVLPGYSPHLNPDELVWNDLKNHTIGKRAFHTVAQLRKLVHDHLEWMRGTRSLIRSFFEEPSVQYAKA